MRQRDKQQKRFSEPDLTRRPTVAVAPVPGEEINERTQRPQRIVPPAPKMSAMTERQVLERQLGGRRALRQAMIVSEILGPPKALRQEE